MLGETASFLLPPLFALFLLQCPLLIVANVNADFIPGRCSNCSVRIAAEINHDMRQLQEKRRLDQIKEEILKKLPNITRIDSVTELPEDTETMPPVFFQKAVQRIVEENRKRYKTTARLNGYYEEAGEIISFAEEASQDDDDQLMFKIQPQREDTDVQVLNANLFVLVRYKKKDKKNKNPMKRVRLRVLEVKQDNSSLPVLQTTLDVEVRHTRWQKLMLPRTIIEETIRKPSRSIYFRITCDNCANDIQPVLLYKKSRRRKDKPDTSTQRNRRGKKTRKPRRERRRRLQKRKPFIIVNTRVKPRRYQRSVARNEERCLATSAPCSLKLFYVSFDMLGWDSWIVSPTGFFANYCEGMCPDAMEETGVGAVPPSSLHNSAVHRFRHLDRPHVPRQPPCCSPIAKEPLRLTYIDPSGIQQVRVMPDMAVTKCACV